MSDYLPMNECPICVEWAAKFGPCGYHVRWPDAQTYEASRLFRGIPADEEPRHE